MAQVETPLVERSALSVGALLAEGGEGRVHELSDRPGMLYKAFRRPAPLERLVELVAWADKVGSAAPELAARVAAASAWPAAVVVDGSGVGVEGVGAGGEGGVAGGVGVEGVGAGGGHGGVAGSSLGEAAGLLIPRAPRRFSLRHRDGSPRLASLSYLTAAPGQRAAAYGLALPAPWSAERIGIVYALARLLEAFQSAVPSVAHGDLSAKNVLWSLERGPEVFVLDCDSSERYDEAGVSLERPFRRRAMTPNWEDPAIPLGANPTYSSDRYSLALIFLRVVAAAHFPLQARQRGGEPLAVDMEVPPALRRLPSLDDGAPIWDLCERSLSVAGATARPEASAWVAAIEAILGDMGATATKKAVWAAQGGGSPAPAPDRPPARADRGGRDVTIRPIDAVGRPRTWERTAVPVAAAGPEATAVGGWRGAPSRPVPAPPRPAPAITNRAILRQAAVALGELAKEWLALHRRTVRSLAAPESRPLGTVRLAGCLVLDVFLAIILGFVVVMIVSPFLGI